MTADQLRAALRAPAGEALNPGDPGTAVMELRALGMSAASESALGAAMWQIWGRIAEEWTRPEGDVEQGARWARESAIELLEAVGDPEEERAYCERWVYDERLGIAPGRAR